MPTYDFNPLATGIYSQMCLSERKTKKKKSFTNADIFNSYYM